MAVKSTKKAATKKTAAPKKKASPKTDKPQEKREVGRPTLYRPEYTEQAYKLCLLGATDKEMADFFKVEEKTLNNWKSDFPEFLQSITRGKDLADAEVAASLYKRATGMVVKETRTSGGGSDDNAPAATETIKEIPPDTQAASLWLRNRQSGKWRDKVDHEVTGKDGGPVETKVTYTAEEAYLIAIQGKK